MSVILPEYELKHLGYCWYIDLVVYLGGLYYALVHLLIGPVVRARVSSRILVAELGRKLFYRIDEEVEKFPKEISAVNGQGRVRINVINGLADKSEGNGLRVRVPRVYIDENGQIVEQASPTFFDHQKMSPLIRRACSGKAGDSIDAGIDQSNSIQRLVTSSAVVERSQDNQDPNDLEFEGGHGAPNKCPAGAAIFQSNDLDACESDSKLFKITQKRLTGLLDISNILR